MPPEDLMPEDMIPEEQEDGIHYLDPNTGMEDKSLFTPWSDFDDEEYGDEDDDEQEVEEERQEDSEDEGEEPSEDETEGENPENPEEPGEPEGPEWPEGAGEAGAEGLGGGAGEAAGEAAAEAGAEATAEAGAEALGAELASGGGAVAGGSILWWAVVGLLVILGICLLIWFFFIIYSAVNPSSKGTSCTALTGLGGADTDGYYQLPASGNYNLNVNSGSPPSQQWGRQDLIQLINDVGASWTATYPDQKFGVGDLNAPGHGSHDVGKDVDIYGKNKLMMSSPPHTPNGSYDRNLTIELAKKFFDTNAIDTIWYNDGTVVSELNKYIKDKGLAGKMNTLALHDDHFHVRIVPGKYQCKESTGTTTVIPSGSWIWPAKMPPASYSNSASADYGPRVPPKPGASKYHGGIDIGGPSGTPIYASRNGVVTAATFSSGNGNYVKIDHKDGYLTAYLHNSKLLVKAGDVVTQGQEIAKMGSTGMSTGPHLHFSVYVGANTIDPETVLPKL